MAKDLIKPGPEDKKAKKLAAEGDVLMREVDEAVRQDDMAQFGKRYGVAVVSALVLGLAAFGGYLYWNNSQEQARQGDSETLITAMDQQDAGNLSAASQALDPLANGKRAGSRAIALMAQGAIALQDGKPTAAAEIFASVADDPDIADEIRELARVRQVSALYDQLEPAEIVRMLDAAAKPGRPFFPSAAEMVAMALVEQGKRQEAGTLFAQIARDENAPQTLQARARQMAGLMGVDAVDDADDIVGGNTGDANAQAAS